MRRWDEGDLSPLLAWLRAKVHGQGSLLEFNDLLSEATGKPLDPADFEAHLTARYLELNETSMNTIAACLRASLCAVLAACAATPPAACTRAAAEAAGDGRWRISRHQHAVPGR